MTQQRKKDFARRISQANKSQMIVIIYELLLIYLQCAKEVYQEDNKSEFCSYIKKARGCIQELIASLHLEYEMAQNMLSLYRYSIKELAHADAQNSLSSIQNVIDVMTSLYEAYQVVSKNDGSAPVMQNTQTVYAGLTYGKESLTENLGNQNINRGFLV